METETTRADSNESADVQCVTDLYQASFYVLNGCEVVAVECIPSGMATSCQIMISGGDLSNLTQIWFEQRAVANLASFRRAYNQVYTLCQQAKRNFGSAPLATAVSPKPRERPSDRGWGGQS